MARATSTNKIIKRGALNGRWRGVGPIPHELYSRFHLNARKRDIAFNLTIEQMAELWERQGGKCALSGADLIIPSRSRMRNLPAEERARFASLDRIDPLGTYDVQNVWWVAAAVNM